MEIYKGMSTFAGIAIGKIFYYNRAEYQLSQYLINNVKHELTRFEQAKDQVFKNLQDKLQTADQEAQKVNLQHQISALSMESFEKAVESMIRAEKVSAVYAVMTTKEELSSTFASLENPAVKEQIRCVRLVSDQLITVLGGVLPRIDLGEEPVILVSDSLSPTEIMEMDKGQLLAVVTQQGSQVSHAAILARTMAVPSIVGIRPEEEWNGLNAIVDGYTGTLYIQPDGEFLKEYEIRRNADIEEREELLKLRHQKDETADGHKVPIYANIGNLDDLNSVLYYEAAGIGLLRSEFQYLGRENYPSEEELFAAYKRVAQTMGEKKAVIRTVDLGADKQAKYLKIPEETNPIMGNRGIRLCLDRREMFKVQLRAIYRASVYGHLALMYPMIDSMEEMDAIEQILDEVRGELDEKKQPYQEIPKAIMIETPAAVMISEELARRVDFLSLGTNDLTQYTLAMDRQNPLLREKYNDHHPAVLKMIQMVVDAGHKNGRKVYICGEIAADTKLTHTFIRMGVDGLSVVPACILPVRRAVRNTDLTEGKD
nr:phosphoenolpyruvate--protein phosphotransferase [uncultured Blautia sp.]